MLQRVTLAVLMMFVVSAFAQKPGGGGGGGGAKPSGGGASASSTNNSATRSPSTLGYPNTGNLGYDPRFSNNPAIYDPTFGRMRTMTPQEERVQRAMMKQRNLEREKTMRTDADHLMALAKSLQSDVNGTPSGDTEKKASQIEKLAKNVKNKMTGEN